MDVAVFAIILLALAAFVATPLYRPRHEPLNQSGHRDARDDSLARALADLEVDRESGLLDEKSYSRERSSLETSHGEPDDD